MSTNKESKKSGQATLFFYYRRALSSLLNSSNPGFPRSLEIAAKIEEADGVIIGTPEYDHSIPAVLMSALAWLSYGIYPLLNKPIMITGASYGTLGSSRAQLQLRQILNAPEIKANVLPDEFLLSHSLQAFNPSGDLVDLDVIKKLDAIFDESSATTVTVTVCSVLSYSIPSSVPTFSTKV